MTGSVPAMDRPSIVLAKALDSIVVGQPDADTLDLVCEECAASICLIEVNDSMRTLFNTALAHVCP